MEADEHLQEAPSSTLVQSMCRHVDLVLFGAAVPLQGGLKHINEQSPSFWVKHFRDEGFQVSILSDRRFGKIRQFIIVIGKMHQSISGMNRVILFVGLKSCGRNCNPCPSSILCILKNI